MDETIKKDVRNEVINIGDKVAFADRKHVQMFIGVVSSFTAKKVRVDTSSTRGFYQSEVLKDPLHLVKL